MIRSNFILITLLIEGLFLTGEVSAEQQMLYKQIFI
jgi:hypothetical protein